MSTVLMSSFSEQLVTWYHDNARDLPWRVNTNSYRVWISEIMLQQTRVITIIPYYHKWLKKFPNVHKLAKADPQDILSLWEGLGYYSRARNIHLAANIIVEKFAGELPQNIKQLQSLPGIGPYTAAAIASIAFGIDIPVVDGNVKRVLSRLFDVKESVDTPIGANKIWGLADKHFPKGNASAYNQGLMELGATICTSKNPKCEHCPINQFCLAYQSGNQNLRPVRNKKQAIPTKYLASAIIIDKQKVWLRQRPQSGLLGGMWEFPNVQLKNRDKTIAQIEIQISKQIGIAVKQMNEVGIFKHAYTHFRINVYVARYEITEKRAFKINRELGKWVSIRNLPDYPMGKVDRLISQRIVE